jgi:hypothetical protein
MVKNFMRQDAAPRCVPAILSGELAAAIEQNMCLSTTRRRSISVFGWHSFGMVDHQDFERLFGRFQFQAELPLHRYE